MRVFLKFILKVVKTRSQAKVVMSTDICSIVLPQLSRNYIEAAKRGIGVRFDETTVQHRSSQSSRQVQGTQQNIPKSRSRSRSARTPQSSQQVPLLNDSVHNTQSNIVKSAHESRSRSRRGRPSQRQSSPGSSVRSCKYILTISFIGFHTNNNLYY